MQETKVDRTRRTVVLLDPPTPNDRGIAWDRIGRSCTELAELYQTVKESRIDLILVDENPLEDVANVGKRTGVMLRGTWLPETRLRGMLDELVESYEKKPTIVIPAYRRLV